MLTRSVSPRLLSISLSVLVIALCVACQRRSDGDEVKKLREEVERLKTAQPAAEVPATARTQPTKEYDDFVRAARRLITAIDAGINYPAFHDRVGDITASALEAAGTTRDPAKRKLIEQFSAAVTDANDLWRCKIQNNKEIIRLKKIGDTYIHEQPSIECSDRWDKHLQELIELYKLDSSDSGYAVMIGSLNIERTLRAIFSYCAKTFRQLDD
jgi:hypothetical protein